MQILLHSDRNSDGGHLMADHLKRAVAAEIAKHDPRSHRLRSEVSVAQDDPETLG